MDFTINFGAINLLVVFAATVVGNLLGGIWYSPIAFGKPWARANNIELGKYDSGANVPAMFTTSFILQLVIASLLAALLGPSAGGQEGVQLGTLMALCFVFTAMGMTNLFERRPIYLILINSSYHIVSFGLMGFIIGTWG
ncbi:MAG: DUF1761 domain-containing protein [Gammaproteobacteria bacterium]